MNDFFLFSTSRQTPDYTQVDSDYGLFCSAVDNEINELYEDQKSTPQVKLTGDCLSSCITMLIDRTVTDAVAFATNLIVKENPIGKYYE